MPTAATNIGALRGRPGSSPSFGRCRLRLPSLSPARQFITANLCACACRSALARGASVNVLPSIFLSVCFIPSAEGERPDSASYVDDDKLDGDCRQVGMCGGSSHSTRFPTDYYYTRSSCARAKPKELRPLSYLRCQGGCLLSVILI